MHLEDWLDDLCVRFIINLPGDDLSSVERICFQVEEAQWYYEDFIRPLDPSLPSLSLRNFSLRIFAHCPLLSSFPQGDHMRAFDEFLVYKKRIPVRGAILLNHAMDSVVLVKGWKKNANWSFPRGKINKDEDDLICAIREVYEETGYDIQAAGLVPTNREVKHITLPLRDQDMKLYVFRDVPMETHFEPRTRKEISKIEWWRISSLPGFRNKKGQQSSETAVNANKFYMVAPFLKDLRKWIIEQKKLDARRAPSSGYLTAGAISHDELFTEEDLGADSALENTDGAPSGVDTLEGATAALKNLLKMQPPTQGLQVDAIRSPIRDSGSELLALLQGPNSNPSQSGSTHAPPHTPLDLTYTQAPAPRTPQHPHPRPPNFSSLPQPPSFNVQQQPDVFSYQLPSRPSQFGHHQQPTPPQHVYQSQPLMHPQPLPPHVQRALFTGGPVHTPTMPKPSQYPPAQNYHSSMAVPNPQFPNIHAPLVPQTQKQPNPKLTKHSLALLDAFKSHDTANGDHGILNDLPSGKYVPGSKQVQQPPLPAPQELPAELSQPPVDLLSMFKANDSPAQTPNTLAPKKQISEAHKSTLLGLFKSPTPQTATISRPTATALPTTSTPSAVELSAVEPHTSSLLTSAHSTKAATPENQVKDIPTMNPEANLPFRATAILARPQQPTEATDRVRHSPVHKSPQNGQNGHGKKHVSRPGKAHTKPSPEKPFQPQILKRTQSGTLNSLDPVSAMSNSPSPFAHQAQIVEADGPPVPPPSVKTVIPRSTDQNATLLSLLGKVPRVVKPHPVATTIDSIKPSDHKAGPLLGSSAVPPHLSRTSSENVMSHNADQSKRQELLSLFGKPSLPASSPITSFIKPAAPQTPDQKQALLSMFKATPGPVSPPSRSSTLDGFAPIQPVSAARSRIGSIAAEAAPHRGSQAPMSPADKSFLLSYLDNVAKGTQR